MLTTLRFLGIYGQWYVESLDHKYPIPGYRTFFSQEQASNNHIRAKMEDVTLTAFEELIASPLSLLASYSRGTQPLLRIDQHKQQPKLVDG